MSAFSVFTERFLTAADSVLWGGGMLCAFLGVGLFFTVGTRFFQFRKIKLWLFSSLGEAFKRGDKKGDGAVTKFQSLTGSLAAAIGTGNIVGVGAALLTGGAGAIFWMWLSSLLGMMTSYAEKLLGIKYRYKNANGSFVGGAMVYMEKGLNCPVMAKIYAFFCVLVSFGMGNLAQANSIASSLGDAFGASPVVTGIITSLMAGIIVFGGVKRIGAVTEKLVPIMALIYISGGLAVILTHVQNIMPSLKLIFSEAFTARAAVGGAGGVLLSNSYGINKHAVKTGVSMGVFSNEAGIGSSVIMHCQAKTDSSAEQGLLGIFEVFADTTVVCSVTALAVLCSGRFQNNSVSAVSLCADSFSTVFGSFGGIFVAVSVVLFAFATIVGWYYYGESSAVYLSGERAKFGYKLIFLMMIVGGSVVKAEFAWRISEQINALAAVPNLIALVLLSGDVFSETKKRFGK